MSNNPIGYADPSGHMRSNEDGSSKHGCHDSKYCKDRDANGNLIIKHNYGENNNARNRCKTDPGLCGGTVYYHGLDNPLLFWGGEYDGNNLASWDGVKQIDPAQWDMLLNDVGSTIQRDGTIGWYDTPLFNGWGSLTGKACAPGGKCYGRTELNYIGEGEALAASGLSKDAAHGVVFLWKNKSNMLWNALTGDFSFKNVSPGTIDMTDVGWDYYHEHFTQSPGSSPHPGH